ELGPGFLAGFEGFWVGEDWGGGGDGGDESIVLLVAEVVVDLLVFGECFFGWWGGDGGDSTVGEVGAGLGAGLFIGACGGGDAVEGAGVGVEADLEGGEGKAGSDDQEEDAPNLFCREAHHRVTEGTETHRGDGEDIFFCWFSVGAL